MADFVLTVLGLLVMTLAIAWFFYYMIYGQGFVPAGFWGGTTIEVNTKKKKEARN